MAKSMVFRKSGDRWVVGRIQADPLPTGAFILDAREIAKRRSAGFGQLKTTTSKADAEDDA
jgi:hypothetical protein